MRAWLDEDIYGGEDPCMKTWFESFKMQENAAATKMVEVPEELESTGKEGVGLWPVDFVLIRRIE